MNKKVIWITGGSTGIGKALALKFANNGWTVAISARRENLLKEIEDKHQNIKSFPLDVNDKEKCKSVFENIKKELGDIEICFFSTGTWDPKKEGQPRLLATDNVVVVPVNKVVKVLITANDVLHAWALPAFGVKRDAMPGRVNETWFKAEKVGTYYGQCSELCGIKHAFMPIEVKVVSEEDYQIWLSEAKIKFAKDENLINKKLVASK